MGRTEVKELAINIAMVIAVLAVCIALFPVLMLYGIWCGLTAGYGS